MVAAIISYLVKTLIFKLDLKDYILEQFIVIFIPVYQFIRLHTLKTSIYSKELMKTSKIVFILVIFFVILTGLIFFGISAESGLYLAIYIVLAALLYISINIFNKKKAQKYESEFDDE